MKTINMRKLIPYITKRRVLLPVLWLIATPSVRAFTEFRPKVEESTRPNKSIEKPVPHDDEDRPPNIPSTEYKEGLSKLSHSETLRKAEMEIKKLNSDEQNKIRKLMRPKIRDFLNQRMSRISTQPCDFGKLFSDLVNGKALLSDSIDEIASNPEQAKAICITFAIKLLNETFPSVANLAETGVGIYLALQQAITSISDQGIDRTLDETFPKTATQDG